MININQVINHAIVKYSIFILLVIAIIVAILAVIIGVPTILIDLMQVMSIALALVFFVFNLLQGGCRYLPMAAIITSVFYLVSSVITTSFILRQGDSIGGYFVGGFEKLMTDNVGIIGIVMGVILYIAFAIIQHRVSIQGVTHITEVAARFFLDAFPGRQMHIESQLNDSVLSEKEAHANILALQRKLDYYDATNTAAKWLASNAKINFAISFSAIFGGLIVGVIFHEQNTGFIIADYIAVCIAAGVIVQIPNFIISASICLQINRFNHAWC